MHVVRAPQQPHRRRTASSATQRRRALDLEAGELQPQLRRLVDGLEQVLVVMRDLVRRLLQRQQLVGAQVALVVASPRRPAGSGVLRSSIVVERSVVAAASACCATGSASATRPRAAAGAGWRGSRSDRRDSRASGCRRALRRSAG